METQNILPQHILPANSSCTEMHFSPKPNNSSQSAEVSGRCAWCSVCPWQPLILHPHWKLSWFYLYAATTFKGSKFCPECRCRAHIRDFPALICSGSFLSGMGQANEIINARQELKHLHFCPGKCSHGAWIGTSFSSLVTLCFAF